MTIELWDTQSGNMIDEGSLIDIAHTIVRLEEAGQADGLTIYVRPDDEAVDLGKEVQNIKETGKTQPHPDYESFGPIGMDAIEAARQRRTENPEYAVEAAALDTIHANNRTEVMRRVVAKVLDKWLGVDELPRDEWYAEADEILDALEAEGYTVVSI